MTYIIYEHMFICYYGSELMGLDQGCQGHDFLKEQTVEEVAIMFKALSDPSRIRILYMLSQEACSVNHIAEVLQLTQSAVSHQLSYLRTLRLVKFRREGNSLFYSCDDEHVISLLKQAIQHAEHR